jgi:hypothetical protein
MLSLGHADEPNMDSFEMWTFDNSDDSCKESDLNDSFFAADDDLFTGTNLLTELPSVAEIDAEARQLDQSVSAANTRSSHTSSRSVPCCASVKATARPVNQSSVELAVKTELLAAARPQMKRVSSQPPREKKKRQKRNLSLEEEIVFRRQRNTNHARKSRMKKMMAKELAETRGKCLEHILGEVVQLNQSIKEEAIRVFGSRAQTIMDNNSFRTQN